MFSMLIIEIIAFLLFSAAKVKLFFGTTMINCNFFDLFCDNF